MNTNRRDFLRNSSLVAAGIVASGAKIWGEKAEAATSPTSTPQTSKMPPETRRGDMIYRQLGSTKERVSLVGLGGFHIGKQKTEAESIKIIRTAVDSGINFMDNCWDYNNGQSEVRMGKALRGGYRAKVFLMTKIDGRTKAAAAHQIEQSLRRLQTAHIDLVQFHEVIRLEDPDRIFAKGGALEAFIDARNAGKIRHIGFTGHKDPSVHLRMLDAAKAHGFRFDTVQMPINVMDAHFRSFTRQVLPRLQAEHIGALAMKTFGDHFILDHLKQSSAARPIELLHYSMSQPVSVVITGIDSLAILSQALEAVRTFRPLTSAQKTSLLARTRSAAVTGKYELFKTTAHFDGTAKNPQWLG